MSLPTCDELLTDIDSTRPEPGCAALWWLGQHSFVLKTPGATIYLDLFLSDHGKRRIPPLLDADRLTNADIFVGTHNHRDHIDREMWPAFAEASPGAVFVVPEFHRRALAADLDIPLDRFAGIDDGTTLELCGVTLHGVASAHEFLCTDSDTGLHPFMGVVVDADGCQVYHSGDTCLYEGMRQALSRFRLSAALLPINGRDAERLARNCIGNMTFQEAADLAGTLRAGVTIPTHHDMFLGNMEDPRKFTDYMRVKYPDLTAIVPGYGERVDLRRP